MSLETFEQKLEIYFNLKERIINSRKLKLKNELILKLREKMYKLQDELIPLMIQEGIDRKINW